MSFLPLTQVLPDESTVPVVTEGNEIIGYLIGSNCQYEIAKGETKIGRDPSECSIVFIDETLSKIHAVIESEGSDDTYVYDAGSTNRTKIGKMRLKPHCRYKLNDGDELTLGTISVIFKIVNIDKDKFDRPHSPSLVPEEYTSAKKTVNEDNHNELCKEDISNVNNDNLKRKNILDILKIPSVSVFKKPVALPKKQFYVHVNEADLDNDIFSQPTQCNVSYTVEALSHNNDFMNQDLIDDCDDAYNAETQCEQTSDRNDSIFDLPTQVELKKPVATQKDILDYGTSHSSASVDVKKCSVEKLGSSNTYNFVNQYAQRQESKIGSCKFIHPTEFNPTNEIPVHLGTDVTETDQWLKRHFQPDEKQHDTPVKTERENYESYERKLVIKKEIPGEDDLRAFNSGKKIDNFNESVNIQSAISSVHEGQPFKQEIKTEALDTNEIFDLPTQCGFVKIEAADSTTPSDEGEVDKISFKDKQMFKLHPSDALTDVPKDDFCYENIKKESNIESLEGNVRETENVSNRLNRENETDSDDEQDMICTQLFKLPPTLAGNASSISDDVQDLNFVAEEAERTISQFGEKQLENEEIRVSEENETDSNNLVRSDRVQHVMVSNSSRGENAPQNVRCEPRENDTAFSPEDDVPTQIFRHSQFVHAFLGDENENSSPEKKQRGVSPCTEKVVNLQLTAENGVTSERINCMNDIVADCDSDDETDSDLETRLNSVPAANIENRNAERCTDAESLKNSVGAQECIHGNGKGIYGKIESSISGFISPDLQPGEGGEEAIANVLPECSDKPAQDLDASSAGENSPSLLDADEPDEIDEDFIATQVAPQHGKLQLSKSEPGERKDETDSDSVSRAADCGDIVETEMFRGNIREVEDHILTQIHAEEKPSRPISAEDFISTQPFPGYDTTNRTGNEDPTVVRTFPEASSSMREEDFIPTQLFRPGARVKRNRSVSESSDDETDSDLEIDIVKINLVKIEEYEIPEMIPDSGADVNGKTCEIEENDNESVSLIEEFDEFITSEEDIAAAVSNGNSDLVREGNEKVRGGSEVYKTELAPSSKEVSPQVTGEKLTSGDESASDPAKYGIYGGESTENCNDTSAGRSSPARDSKCRAVNIESDSDETDCEELLVLVKETKFSETLLRSGEQTEHGPQIKTEKDEIPRSVCKSASDDSSDLSLDLTCTPDFKKCVEEAFLTHSGEIPSKDSDRSTSKKGSSSTGSKAVISRTLFPDITKTSSNFVDPSVTVSESSGNFRSEVSPLKRTRSSAKSRDAVPAKKSRRARNNSDGSSSLRATSSDRNSPDESESKKLRSGTVRHAKNAGDESFRKRSEFVDGGWSAFARTPGKEKQIARLISEVDLGNIICRGTAAANGKNATPLAAAAGKTSAEELQRIQEEGLKMSLRPRQSGGVDNPVGSGKCQMTRKSDAVSDFGRIVFTGYDSELHADIIAKLGGRRMSHVKEGRVLVTDKVRRTVKFLSAVALGLPIASPEWLIASEKEFSLLDPWNFLLKDSEAEAHWKFDLKTTLEKANRQKLLEGYSVYATASTKPPVSDMLAIVECCGGIPLDSQPEIWPEKCIVLTCNEDRKSWPPSKFRRVKIVHYEFLLSGVLRYVLDFKTFRLR